MVTEQLNEVYLFQQFLAGRTQNGTGPQTLQEAIEQFAAYQQELADLHTKLKLAEQQSGQGLSAPFDAQRTKRAVRERLAQEGITD
jgi:hypothetical protein